MKKVPFALVLAFGLASGSAFAASSGTLEVTGNIIATSCIIADGTEAKTVTLATLGTGDLKEGDFKNAPRRFTIKLSGCPVDQKVYASFSGENAGLIDSATGTFFNATTPTSPVRVALWGAEGNERIKLGNLEAAGSYVGAKQVPVGGALDLVYIADYFLVPGATAITGLVTAKANYIIAYQ